MKIHRIGFGKLSQLDVRLLRMFMVIVESGGFSQAQAQLNMAASTMSTRMADLEMRFGVKLCHRGRGGFRLTERGEVIYAEARKLFSSIDHFENAVAEVRGQMIGELRIAIMDNSVLDPEMQLPKSIHHFIGLYPDVHIGIEVLPPEEIESAILDGRADIGVGVFKETSRQLACVSEFSDVLELYCGQSHPLFASAPDKVTVEQVSSVAYAEGVYLSEKEFLAKREAKAIARLSQPTATARQAEGLGYLILSGRYIGFLPKRYAATWVERGMMLPLLPDDYSQQAHFKVLIRRGESRTDLLKSFIDALAVA
ncbi:MAG: LysR family transcriptional regulator [Pseudomonadota bacterium]